MPRACVLAQSYRFVDGRASLQRARDRQDVGVAVDPREAVGALCILEVRNGAVGPVPDVAEHRRVRELGPRDAVHVRGLFEDDDCLVELRHGGVDVQDSRR